MKNCFSVFIILAFFLKVNGQNSSFELQDSSFKLQKSEVFKDEYSNSNIVLAEKISNDNFLIVRSYKSSISVKRGFYIEKYNSSLSKISDFDLEIEQPLHEKYRYFIGAFFSQSKLYLIEMFYDLKTKNYVCKANIIDEQYKITKRELFKFSKDEVKGFGLQNLSDDIDFNHKNLGLFEVEEKLTYNFLKGLVSSKVSDDRSRSEIVFKVNNPKSFFSIALAYKFEKNEFTKLFLFDSDLNKKIEQQFSSENDIVVNKNLELHDNEDVIFLTQKVYSNELKNKEIGGKYFYEIKKITKEAIVSKTINIENHYVTSLITFYLENKLYVVGFYSDNDDFQYGGISFFELNAEDLEITKSKYSQFTEQLILDKYGKVNNKEFKNIVINDLFMDSKNQITINAEEVYSNSSQKFIYSTNSNKKSNMSSQFKSYDDIISITLSNNGDIITARNINKSQTITEAGDASFLSYSSFVLNDVNYFLVNAKDNVKELSNERIEFKSANVNSNSNLFVISVNTTGNLEYKKLLDKEDNEVPFMVAAGIKLNNSIIFLGKKGKKKQLLKIAF